MIDPRRTDDKSHQDCEVGDDGAARVWRVVIGLLMMLAAVFVLARMLSLFIH